jgi:hypothetical protein
MKFKLLAMILALSLAGWAQENSSTPNASSAPGKSCCHHAMDAKDAKGCCHHAEANGTASCCGGNKCSMKDKNATNAQSCCTDKDMKKCMKQCRKNGGCGGKCCAQAGEKSAMNCCGSQCASREQTAAIG